MKHLILFIFQFSVVLNIISCFLTFFVSLKNKNELIKSYLNVQIIILCFVIYIYFNYYIFHFMENNQFARLTKYVFGLIYASQAGYHVLNLFFTFKKININRTLKLILRLVNCYFIVCLFMPAFLNLKSIDSIVTFYRFQFAVVYNYEMLLILIFCLFFYMLSKRKTEVLEKDYLISLIGKALTWYIIFLPSAALDAFCDYFFKLGVIPQQFNFSIILYGAWALINSQYMLKYIFSLISPVQNKNPQYAFFQNYKISRREQDIVFLLLSNKNQNEIASELFISQSTVRNHINSIYHKLSVHTKEELQLMIDQTWAFSFEDNK